MRTSREYIEVEGRYGAKNYHPLPIVIARGEGEWVYDPEGRRYLDCLSSYSALNQGYAHPRIMAAVREQIETGVTLTSRAFYNTRLGDFLKKVCDVTGMDRALPMNSGAEAVETAIKMARKYAVKKRGVEPDQAEIIVFTGNFHGRTTTIVGFSDEDQYRDGFGPFTPGFVKARYGDLESFRAAVTDRTAAVLVEPIQGEGGIIIPPDGYLAEMARICRERGILFIADEIQTGLARTGRMFACDHEGVKPDAYILGKALSGGVMPVSAVASTEEILSVFTPGDHGSTYGGNPLGAAAGIAALDVIVEEELARRAAESGTWLLDALRRVESRHVKEVRGRGLLIGVEVKAESGKARPFCERLMERGVLCKETHDQVIRFAPPLVIRRESLEFLMDAVRAVLAE